MSHSVAVSVTNVKDKESDGAQNRISFRLKRYRKKPRSESLTLLSLICSHTLSLTLSFTKCMRRDEQKCELLLSEQQKVHR